MFLLTVTKKSVLQLRYRRTFFSFTFVRCISSNMCQVFFFSAVNLLWTVNFFSRKSSNYKFISRIGSGNVEFRILSLCWCVTLCLVGIGQMFKSWHLSGALSMFVFDLSFTDSWMEWIQFNSLFQFTQSNTILTVYLCHLYFTRK